MSGGLVGGERALLERIALGHPLSEVLDGIVLLIEGQADGLFGSVLLLDSERACVRLGASPSLPTEYSSLLDGLAIGPTAGSCGAAAFLGEQVIVEDIAVHPNWERYRALALPFGLRACWSTPIFAPDRKVLGTFAIYYRAPRRPAEEELAWVQVATHLASIAILRDRSEAERRRLEHEIEQGDRLQSLGTLAAGIAHDFNNALSAVQANAELALMDLDNREACHRRLLAVQQASKHASELVRRMLTFSRQHTPRREMSDLTRAVEEALALARGNLPDGVEVERRFSDIPPVSADPIQVQQVVLNLLANATHAIGAQRGVIQIALERCTVEAGAAPAGLTPGEHVRLTIRDTGCGMTEAVARRAFDPFFTTKPQGEGTGLGLSTVHGIMKQHDGAITLSSIVGEGTTFSLYFPVPRTLPRAPEAVAPSSLRILLADDEEAFLFFVRRVLERRGHIVTAHTSPVAALEAFRSAPDDFDALVTDVGMPELSGPELVEQVRALRPSLHVVLVTGFVRTEDQEAATRVGAQHLVPKPVSMVELERTILPLLPALRASPPVTAAPPVAAP